MKKILICLLLMQVLISKAETVNVVLSTTPGGTLYSNFQQLQNFLEKKNVTILPRFKVGAESLIAAEDASKSKPDGSTIWLTTVGGLSNAKNNNFEFEYVTMIDQPNFVLVANPKLNIHNYNDFLSNLKSDKSYSFSYTSKGHLFSIKQLLNNVHPKTESLMVPYKGVPNLLIDLIGGVTDFSILPYSVVKDYIKDEKLVLISSTTTLSDYPNIVVFEKLYKNWLDLNGFAVVLPKGTPKQIVLKWQNYIKEFEEDQETKKFFMENYFTVTTFGDKYLKDRVERVYEK